MTKEYELIACQEFGVPYKRWVRVKTRTTYLGLDVFLYRPHPDSLWVVTHYHTGKAMAPAGKVSPYPGGVTAYLDKVLTQEQKDKVQDLAGHRLYLAHLYSLLCGLPPRRQAAPLIQAKREEAWRLEGIITGQDLPW